MSNRTYFIHLRDLAFDRQANKMVVRSTGGATVLVAENDDNTVDLTYSLVSDNDNYCKKTGRNITKARYTNKAEKYMVRNVPVKEGAIQWEYVADLMSHMNTYESEVYRLYKLVDLATLNENADYWVESIRALDKLDTQVQVLA